MKTIKELQLSLIVKEAMIQQLKYKIELLNEEIGTIYEDIIDKAVDFIKLYPYYIPEDAKEDLINILRKDIGDDKE